MEAEAAKTARIHGRRGAGRGHHQGAAGHGGRLLAPQRSRPPTTRWSSSRLWRPSPAAADGRATKIIIPSEIQGIAGLAEGIVEAVKPAAPAEKTAPAAPQACTETVR